MLSVRRPEPEEFLLLLARPVIVSALLYYVLTEPAGVLPALVTGAPGVFVLWAYRTRRSSDW